MMSLGILNSLCLRQGKEIREDKNDRQVGTGVGQEEHRMHLKHFIK